jgi:capsular polysaccharide biosynthesis protein
MSRVIFHIENRGSIFIYHWFIYMISGLRYVEVGGNDGVGGSGKLEQNKELFNGVLSEPYNLYFSKNPSYKDEIFMLDFQKETFDLLKYKFRIVESVNDDDIIINNYGEPIIDDGSYHISGEGYNYLKKIFDSTNNRDYEIKYKKKYYLCRSKSHLLSGNEFFNNVKKRQIINETDLCDTLKKYGVQILFLEDLQLDDKIKLFKDAETIISPNSGGLLFSLFSENTKIIEINVNNPTQISNQYLSICNHFNIPYFKYIENKIDDNDNMNINIDDFINFLKNNKII